MQQSFHLCPALEANCRFTWTVLITPAATNYATGY